MTDRGGASRAESWLVLAFAVAASVAANLWSWSHQAMLNYGDAVAHLHIARRVFDSHRPGLSQLGSATPDTARRETGVGRNPCLAQPGDNAPRLLELRAIHHAHHEHSDDPRRQRDL